NGMRILGKERLFRVDRLFPALCHFVSSSRYKARLHVIRLLALADFGVRPKWSLKARRVGAWRGVGDRQPQ
ncbi:hypothetical protein, partial [Sinorhizobium medicae]|uniref:hypothetical protein n=1 Tax=Sinorhizobium medicae TaxID=110321 RepID=UPI002B1BD91C